MAKKQKPVINETIESEVFTPITEFDFSNSVTENLTTGQPTRNSILTCIALAQAKIEDYKKILIEIERQEKIKALEKELETLRQLVIIPVSSPASPASPVTTATTIDNKKVFQAIQSGSYDGLNSSEKTLALKLACIHRGFQGQGKSGLNCLTGLIDKPVEEIVAHAKKNNQSNQIPLIKRYLKMKAN